MDFDTDKRVSVCVKKGQFLFFGVFIFFFKHVSTSHFFFICVYTTRNTSHISQHLTIRHGYRYLIHAQAAHARDRGQARLHSGAAAALPASPLLSNGLPLPALSPLALLSSSDSVPYEVVRCQDSPLLAHVPHSAGR